MSDDDNRKWRGGALVARELGLQPYRPVFEAMRRYTQNRAPDSPDQIWILEHYPVYTLGLAGKKEHILAPGGIPVLQADRGGQITYHGPGQLVYYLLLDLKRKALTAKGLVHLLEQAVIDALAGYGLSGERRPGAPGVYIDGAKIAALGLRIRRGCSYHGLSFNVDMNTAPFAGINPCGYAGLRVTQLKAWRPTCSKNGVMRAILQRLVHRLGAGRP